ncbi:hypothetical protein B0H34DRAFT_668570, partial [Crassisporium funariophilum]
HASACNVVERIFGSFKKHFGILTSSPQYNMDIHARIPPALAAIHNFILKDDLTEAEEIAQDNAGDPLPGNLPLERDFGTLARGAPGVAEKTRAKLKWDTIAQAMWVSYQDTLAQCNQMEGTLE